MATAISQGIFNPVKSTIPASSVNQTPSAGIGDPTAEALALSVQLNPLYVQNFKTAMNAVAPGAANQVASNISQLLAGQLPADVQSQIMQSAAEANISQGRYGEAAGNRTMRDIGQTSLQAEQLGTTQLQSLMPQLPDIDTLINQQRSYDVTKTSMDVSASEYAASLAESQATLANQTALQSLNLTLAQQSEAASVDLSQQQITNQSNQFQQNLSFEQQISAWNKQYEQATQQLAQQQAQQAQALQQSDFQQLLDAKYPATTSVSSSSSVPISDSTVESSSDYWSPPLGPNSIISNTGDVSSNTNNYEEDYWSAPLGPQSLIED